MALQYRMQTGEPERTRILAFDQAYHGDTMGAAALGGVSRFFERFRSFGLAVDFISSADDLQNIDATKYAAVVIEPIVQGVNQMRIWSVGMLRALREWCDAHDVHLILDEVMTGFGRTGKLFACEHEQVIPDFLCLAKGLTGGYLPLAATLTTEKIYRAFLGKENVFYYGHSFTANQLGCAAALANLEILRRDYPAEVLAEKSAVFGEILQRGLADLAQVYQVRHCGMLAGIELREVDGRSFSVEDGIGAKVCVKAREYGLITRPILDTIVLMPPLCSTEEELEFAVSVLRTAIVAVFFSKK
jgi:adenosylmethionine-8-amino-7-oxononanoate aminotransferase